MKRRSASATRCCTRRQAADTGLRAFEPHAEGLETFHLLGKRLDWILISPELEFISYDVLPDVLSDHRAVMSEITWIKPPARAG